MAGRKRVKSFAVPFLTYSCGCRAGSRLCLAAGRILSSLSGVILTEERAITGMRLPCAAARARSRDLRSLVLAVAFWHLRDQGLVRLEVVQERIKLSPIHVPGAKEVVVKVRVRRVQSRALSFPASLEQELLEFVGAGGDQSVADVVAAWFGRRYSAPSYHVLEVVTEYGHALGYATESRFLFRRKLEWDCGKVTTLARELESLLRRWIRATAATLMTAVALHVSVRLNGPLTWSRITLRSDPNTTTNTSNGGATSPLITAVRNSALIGSMWRKFKATPTSVASTMMR